MIQGLAVSASRLANPQQGAIRVDQLHFALAPRPVAGRVRRQPGGLDFGKQRIHIRDPEVAGKVGVVARMRLGVEEEVQLHAIALEDQVIRVAALAVEPQAAVEIHRPLEISGG